MKNLDDYKKGQLSEEEESEFLQNAFDAKKRLELKKDWEQKLSEKFEVNKKTGPNPPKRNSRKNVIWLSIAAAIIFLLGFFFLLPSSPNQPQQLAKNFIQSEVFPNNLGTRNDDNKIQLREQATDAYKNENYEEAIQLYEQLLQKDSILTEDYFFQGLSFLYTAQYDQSSEALTEALKLSSTKNKILHNEIHWYLGLSLIMNGNFAEAKSSLNQIKENDWKYKQAQELLKSL